MSPQQAFAVVSAPARLILLTEQTRAGSGARVAAVFCRACAATSLGAAGCSSRVILPPLLSLTPDLIRLFFSEKNVGAIDARGS